MLSFCSYLFCYQQPKDCLDNFQFHNFIFAHSSSFILWWFHSHGLFILIRSTPPPSFIEKQFWPLWRKVLKTRHFQVYMPLMILKRGRENHQRGGHQVPCSGVWGAMETKRSNVYGEVLTVQSPNGSLQDPGWHCRTYMCPWWLLDLQAPSKIKHVESLGYLIWKWEESLSRTSEKTNGRVIPDTDLAVSRLWVVFMEKREVAFFNVFGVIIYTYIPPTHS